MESHTKHFHVCKDTLQLSFTINNDDKKKKKKLNILCNLQSSKQANLCYKFRNTRKPKNVQGSWGRYILKICEYTYEENWVRWVDERVSTLQSSTLYQFPQRSLI